MGCIVGTIMTILNYNNKHKVIYKYMSMETSYDSDTMVLVKDNSQSISASGS